MNVSEARIAANRRNALRSTGPKTPEGKERSRANALKHGLCAAVVVPESVELIQQRACDFYDTLRPQNEYHSWLVDKVAILSIRIDRCERIERRFRDRHSYLTEVGWEDDRRAQAETIGSRLQDRPAEVVEALRRTPQGCEWLMTRWAMLAYCADEKKEWTPDQVTLAFDLLATPAQFRQGHKPGVSINFDGKMIEAADDPAAVARREIALLKERREAVLGIDEVDRTLAEADLSEESHPELKRLRRYESALHGRMRWCLGQIRYQSPEKVPHPGLRPKWVINPATEAKPTATQSDRKEAELRAASGYQTMHPPFDLEPDEVPPRGERLDVPAVLSARRQKKLEKADARRDARRRKVDKLRS
jgi:hypothetical protein